MTLVLILVAAMLLAAVVAAAGGFRTRAHRTTVVDTPAHRVARRPATVVEDVVERRIVE